MISVENITILLIMNEGWGKLSDEATSKCLVPGNDVEMGL